MIMLRTLRRPSSSVWQSRRCIRWLMSSSSVSLEQRCVSALRNIRDTPSSKDIVFGNMVRQVRVAEDGSAIVYLEPSLQFRSLREQVQRTLSSLDDITSVEVSFGEVPPAQDEDLSGDSVISSRKSRHHGLSDVTSIIAVSSCKGGVGKSTVAVNLAYSLASIGLDVGLFDADLYGPSLPTFVSGMKSALGSLSSEPMRAHKDQQGQVLPIVLEGVKMMSFGFVSSDDAAVLRGPVASRIVQQLALGTRWGRNDYLIVDLPPGTGDINLSISQSLDLDASVLVTTPHPLSYADVVRGVSMMGSLGIPTIAAVQNMSSFSCSNCGTSHRVWGTSIRERLTHELGIQNVVDVPVRSELADLALPLALTDTAEASDLKVLLAEFASGIHREVQNLRLHRHTPPEVMFERERGIVIKYSDGRESIVEAAKLRRMCRCAKCTQRDGRGLVVGVSDDVQPTLIKRLGTYAVAVEWSDGHKSSIYSFASLKSMAA